MINRKLVETPVRMMNRMEEITDLICEYNEEVQKQQQEIERLNNIIKEVRKYIENNWISKKDADNYRFDDEELDIEISDIAVLYDILNKGE